MAYGYDDGGHLVRYEVGQHLGDEPDQVSYGTCDDRGNILLWEVDGYAGAFDGEIDLRTSYTYDDSDHMLSKERDEGADGAPEYRRTYAYDALGNLESEDNQGYSGFERDWHWTYTWDCP